MKTINVLIGLVCAYLALGALTFPSCADEAGKLKLIDKYLKGAFPTTSGTLVKPEIKIPVRIDFLCYRNNCDATLSLLRNYLPGSRFDIQPATELGAADVSVVVVEKGNEQILGEKSFSLLPGEQLWNSSPAPCASFAIINKDKAIRKLAVVSMVAGSRWQGAGCVLVGLLSASGYWVKGEVIDFILAAPPFDRSHILMKAMGGMLLLQYSPALHSGMTREQVREDLLSASEKDLFGTWLIETPP